MAIYHASTKPIARSAGRSAVAAAAYCTGSELVDKRTGLVHDYTRKDGVVSSDIITPDGGTADRLALWNAAEQAEKRKDARTAREWIVALPSELDAGQRRELALSFGAELTRRYGVAVDVCIHQPDREGDNRNHHAHILTTTRQVSRGPDGALVLGEKASIELSDKKRREQGLGAAADEVKAVRELWEATANTALQKAGRAERIDARSLEAQGIDREATTHLGPTASEMERRGRASDRGDGNRQVTVNNAQRQAIKAEIIDLKVERERREKVRQVETIPAADLVKQWDARKLELARDYRQRAQRLEERVWRQVEAIGDQRGKDRQKHAQERPQEPTGLFGAFRKGAYEKALTAWQEAAKRIEAWKQDREAGLRKRVDWVREFLKPNSWKLDQTVTAKLERERPEWAARLPSAQAQVKQQRQNKIREKMTNQKGRPDQGHSL